MELLLAKQWHHLAADEVLELVGSAPEKGLDVFEVEQRQQRFGPNVLTPQPGKSPLARFLLQFHHPLLYILMAAAVITALSKEMVDAAVIFGVVLINAIIGYVQEAKAEKALDALARTMTTSAAVIRAGQKQQIDATGLVPGDIVLLQAGDKVPADLRLVQSRDLQVDEAALTGESMPVEKQADQRLDTATVLADRVLPQEDPHSLIVKGAAFVVEADPAWRVDGIQMWKDAAGFNDEGTELLTYLEDKYDFASE